MKCYRTNCNCDDIKKMYCMFRVTKEQQRFIAKIRKHKLCKECEGITVKAKYNGIEVDLCTNCGRIWKGRRIIESCWVNSRRAG